MNIKLFNYVIIITLLKCVNRVLTHLPEIPIVTYIIILSKNDGVYPSLSPNDLI